MLVLHVHKASIKVAWQVLFLVPTFSLCVECTSIHNCIFFPSCITITTTIHSLHGPLAKVFLTFLKIHYGIGAAPLAVAVVVLAVLFRLVVARSIYFLELLAAQKPT